MGKKIISVILAVLMTLSCFTASAATGGSTSGGGGGGTSNVALSGKVILPDGYVFSGREELMIYISESYDSWGYVFYGFVPLNTDGTYSLAIPDGIVGNYAVSAEMIGFNAPVVEGYYDYDGYVQFTGQNVAGIDFVVDTGYTVSGEILFDDIEIENALVNCFVTAYKYNGTFLDMEEIGEGEFYKSYIEKTDSFDYSLTVPEDVEEIVVVVSARCYSDGMGEMKSNLIGDYVYYAGSKSSTLDYTKAEVIRVDGNVSGIDIPLKKGVGFSFKGSLPAGVSTNTRRAVFSIADKNMNEIYNAEYYFGSNASYETIVLPYEYLDEEVYVYYDLVYNDDNLYSDRVFINPDLSLAKNQEEAKLHTLSETNNINFTLARKSDYVIKGKISFEEGCDLAGSGFSCYITAKNTATYESYSTNIYQNEIGEYEYYIPVEQAGMYKVYANISSYSNQSNISHTTYYYSSSGNAYNYEDAEPVNVSEDVSADIEFKKLRTFKGKFIADNEIVFGDNFQAELYIYSEKSNCNAKLEVEEDGSFKALIHPSIIGKCSAYINVDEGSNIIPEYYYYSDDSGNEDFYLDLSKTYEFKVETGKVISGKLILPEGAEVGSSCNFDVGLTNTNGASIGITNLNFKNGEKEKEFIFAIPSHEDEYVLYAKGLSYYSDSNLYDENIYYVENKKSTINLSSAEKLTSEGKENIEFYALYGTKTPITVKNEYNDYVSGSFFVEAENFKKELSFYLNEGKELSKNIVLTQEHVGQEVYVYYTLSNYPDIVIYVNPDKSLTNKKSEAKKHKITDNTSFSINISADESIYHVPPIKGTISLSETAFVKDEYNQPTNITGNLYIYNDSQEVYYKRIYVSKEEKSSFEATVPEEGDYKLSVYLNRPWGSTTNLICNETLWYTDNGWSLNKEEAKIINNSQEVNLNLVIPEVPTIKGSIKFPEEAYTETEIPVIITAVSPEGREGEQFVKYLNEISDFDFYATGIPGVEKYNLKVQFGYSYSEYDTNLPTGKTFYITENGLSAEADAVKKVLTEKENVKITAPVNKMIVGTVKFPDDVKLGDYTNISVSLYEENTDRGFGKSYSPDNTEAIEFKFAATEETKKYRVVVYVSADEDSNLESGSYYLTKGGLTGLETEEYFTIDEIKNAEIVLQKKRYLSGKIYASDYKSYGDGTGTVNVGFTSGYMTTYREAQLDENLNFVVQIPQSIYGEGYITVKLDENNKNNVVKEEYYDYKDKNGNKKTVVFGKEDVSDITIEVETGNVISGKLVLPESVDMPENSSFNAYVHYGNTGTYSEAVFKNGQKEADFFMVIPKDYNYAYNLNLYVSNSASSVCPDLYLGDIYYTKNGSTIYESKADTFSITKDVTDLKFELLTGAVYEFELSMPSYITNTENVSLYAQINSEKFNRALSLGDSNRADSVSFVFPEEYNGQDVIFYYDILYSQDNELYREKVYIKPDGSLNVDSKFTTKHKINGENCKFNVELAKLDEIEKPEYELWTQYPYKDNVDNIYSYEYSGEEEIDYLKITFSDECYLAYGDYAYINYGDGQKMGPYRTNALAGETINIAGDKFSIEITSTSAETAFGIAATSIEGKKFTIETEHPYKETVYPYTYSKNAEGLRIYFEDTVEFSGSMAITYNDKNGNQKTDYYSTYNLAGKSVDVRGNSFTITLPANKGSYYGFSITDIDPIEYHNVTFKNYDGEVLGTVEVENGKGIYKTNYYFEEPTKERDENYIYTFKGWDKNLDSITSDMEVFAQYREDEYYTVEFKESEGSDVLYTAYVIKGEEAEYDCEILPVKASTEKYGYVFAGWNINLEEITSDCTALAIFEEKEIILQSEHPYKKDGTLEYTYNYDGSADSLILEFSSDTVFNDGDLLLVYSEDYTQIYDSKELSSEAITVTGKNVRFVIQCNSQQGGNGFALVGVTPRWHEFSDWYTYITPGCLTEGKAERWCEQCGKTEERIVKPLGHSFGVWEKEYDENGNETGEILRTCTRCTEKEMFDGDLSDCSIVNLKIVDAVTMKPLSNASVTAYDEDGNETVFYTNNDGTASQILLNGTNNLVIYYEDYIMRNISVNVNGMVTDVPVIGLTQKPAVECKLEAKIMDMEEIKAAGIDTTDPLNSHVFKYSINLGFGEEQTIYFNKKGEYIDRGNIVVYGEANDVTATIHPVNERYYLVIYGQAKWLKEMFDVELVALNTSNTDTIEDLTAEIMLPDGMSLAAMDREQQSDVIRMGTLDSNESKSVHWYVRGDKKGEYNISAKLLGKLMPFDEQFCYEYSTEEPVKVYAGDALEMNIVIPSTAVYGEDYTVRIEIENVSDRPIYNLTNSTDKIIQSKFLKVDENGYEKYFEENALGYVKVDELKPGEKIVSEIKSNILFESETVKNQIDGLAYRLKDETDILAIFRAYKSTLDLFNDNYDIVYNALGNAERSLTHIDTAKKESAENLVNVLSNCEALIKDGVSSRAMYFINRLKQENTFEELKKLSKDANYYAVWSDEKIQKLANELKALSEEAISTDKCSDYDVYENMKRVVGTVPASFWLKSAVVMSLEGSTTNIPCKVTVVPSEEAIGVTNISNYYYNLLSGAIEKMGTPAYTQINGDIRDKDGVIQVNEILKAQVEENLVFEVTDVSGDTRFNAWVEGEDGAIFEISSTAENAGVTEGGITFTGPSYLMISSKAVGKGTLYIEKVSDAALFTTTKNVYSYNIETVKKHVCENNEWVEVVTAYDDIDGYEAKYCNTCGVLMDMRTIKATDECGDGSFTISDEKMTKDMFNCKISFDSATNTRSAKVMLVVKNKVGEVVHVGTDDIKIKPNSTVDVEIPIKDVEFEEYKVLLWDNFMKLRPVANN